MVVGAVDYLTRPLVKYITLESIFNECLVRYLVAQQRDLTQCNINEVQINNNKYSYYYERITKNKNFI